MLASAVGRRVGASEERAKLLTCRCEYTGTTAFSKPLNQDEVAAGGTPRAAALDR
ncbi:MAG: hypothetical protein F6K11_23260 [Leptolyngbya sp. SIO3F4]|nr:hypothetical protein [Leptolyngbya sp. SIO3F4]